MLNGGKENQVHAHGNQTHTQTYTHTCMLRLTKTKSTHLLLLCFNDLLAAARPLADTIFIFKIYQYHLTVYEDQ